MTDPWQLPATNPLRPIPEEHLLTEPLTPDEEQRLSADPRLANYPHGDYLDGDERERLSFIKWLHDTKGLD